MPTELKILTITHALLAAVALWRLWWGRKPSRDGGVFMPVLWSLIAVLFPFLGPTFALAFGRLPSRHGEDAPQSTYTRIPPGD